MLKGSIGMTGDFIKIANLKVFAHHGVFPEETRDGQDFYVNAKLFLDCRKAGKTDNLSDSLNYGEVSPFITDFLQDHTYKLIGSCLDILFLKLSYLVVHYMCILLQYFFLLHL